jgi:hypothetical protein
VVHLSDLLARWWLIAIGLCILAIGFLHLAMASAIFVEIGLFVVIIAIIMRKFRPKSMGVWWVFEVREWVGLLGSGISFMAFGIFFIILAH